MKSKLKKRIIPPADLRVLLEKVLTAEIEIASTISEVREKADKAVIDAQSNTIKLKNNIIEKARLERDQILNEGLEKARKESQKTIEKSRVEAQDFLSKGQGFITEAGRQVIDLLLGLESGDPALPLH